MYVCMTSVLVIFWEKNVVQVMPWLNSARTWLPRWAWKFHRAHGAGPPSATSCGSSTGRRPLWQGNPWETLGKCGNPGKMDGKCIPHLFAVNCWEKQWWTILFWGILGYTSFRQPIWWGNLVVFGIWMGAEVRNKQDAWEQDILTMKWRDVRGASWIDNGECVYIYISSFKFQLRNGEDLGYSTDCQPAFFCTNRRGCAPHFVFGIIL